MKAVWRTGVVAALFLVLRLEGSAAFLGEIKSQGTTGAPRDTIQRSDRLQERPLATIRGRVTAAETGAALIRAQVTIRGTGKTEPRITTTDERGRFEFRDLVPGRYTLSAAKSGYVTTSFGQEGPYEAGRPVEASENQILERIDFTLTKSSVIVVQVTDPFGEPLAGVRVQAQNYRFFRGERRLEPARTGSVFSETDDRGNVRLYGLLPGDYYVSATPISERALGTEQKERLITTFYPGTPSLSESQVVSLRAGDEFQIGFSMVAGGVATISGTIRGSDGQVLARPYAGLRLEQGSGYSVRGIVIQTDGTFSLSNVASGSYSIIVQSGIGANGSDEFAIVPLQIVGEDVAGLSITTTKTGTLRGQFVFDVQGSSSPRDLEHSAIQLSAIPFPTTLGLSAGRLSTNDDWTFEMGGLSGSRLVRLVTGSSGWFLKAVLLNGKDITDDPLDFTHGGIIDDVRVVLTQKHSDVSGTVIDSRNNPATRYVALLFAEDRAHWTPQSRFIAVARPDQNGRFRITGLPSGRYRAAAVTAIEVGQERDPELLDRLVGRASPVSVTEGEAIELTLRLVTF